MNFTVSLTKFKLINFVKTLFIMSDPLTLFFSIDSPLFFIVTDHHIPWQSITRFSTKIAFRLLFHARAHYPWPNHPWNSSEKVKDSLIDRLVNNLNII